MKGFAYFISIGIQSQPGSLKLEKYDVLNGESLLEKESIDKVLNSLKEYLYKQVETLEKCN